MNIEQSVKVSIASRLLGEFLIKTHNYYSLEPTCFGEMVGEGGSSYVCVSGHL